VSVADKITDALGIVALAIAAELDADDAQ